MKPVQSSMTALVLLLWTAALSPLSAGQAGVDLRVVDETAPPGGLAVVLVELTEPKPISRGRVRLSVAGSPLGEIVGAAILDPSGGTSSRVISLQGEAVMEFSSPTAVLGTDPQLPFMVVAIEVRPTALPGQTVPLQLDLSQSEFFDPQDQLYPEEMKPGTFTVGGLSITDVNPLTGSVESGAVIQITGVGFDPGVDVNIEGANLTSFQTLNPNQIQVRLAADFEILGTTRFRLRNPDDSEDFFYPTVLMQPGGSGNTPPTARDDVLTTLEDTPIVFSPADNDSDPDGDPLRVVSVGQPLNGSAVVVDDRQVRYTPAADYHGSDSFDYTIEDGRGAMVGAAVSIMVEPVNDPPVAVLDEVLTDVDSPVTFFPLENDFDVEADPLSLAAVSSSAGGALFFNGEGSLTYVPHPLFEGSDVFTYQASDGQGGLSEGQVQIQVRRLNQAPFALDDVAATTIGEAVEIPLLANDSDLNGDLLQIAIESSPPRGSVQVVDRGVVRYQPATGFQGIETFQYQAQDEGALTDTATVTVVVNPSAGLTFEPAQLELPTGSSERLSLQLGQMAAEASKSTAPIQLESTPAGIVDHPSALAPGEGNSLSFSVFGVRPGTAVITAVLDSAQLSIPVAVQPGKVFEIPLLGESPELELGVAIGNRSSQSASVRLRRYSSGELESESLLDVEARAQSAFLLGEQGGAEAPSWVEIAALDRNVFPLFLYFARPIGGFAGASTVPRANSWTFPFSPSREGEKLRLGLVNNNFNSAEVSLIWRPESGVPQQISRTIGPQSSFSGELAQLFPGWQPTAGSLLLQSSEPLGSYFLASTDAYLAGQSPQASAAVLHAPHVVSGGGWSARLNLANPEQQDQLIVVRLNVETGAPPPPVQLGIPAGSSRSFEIGELFGLGPEAATEGSLVIEGQAGLAASVLLTRAEQLGAMAPVLSEPFTEAVFSQVVSGPIQGIDLFTGIAFDNVDDRDAVVIVDVYSPTGQLLGHAPFLLPAGRRSAQLLRELVDFPEPVAGGYLRIRSSRPLALAVLLGDSSLSFLSSVDAASVGSPER